MEPGAGDGTGGGGSKSAFKGSHLWTQRLHVKSSNVFWRSLPKGTLVCSCGGLISSLVSQK